MGNPGAQVPRFKKLGCFLVWGCMQGKQGETAVQETRVFFNVGMHTERKKEREMAVQQTRVFFSVGMHTERNKERDGGSQNSGVF